MPKYNLHNLNLQFNNLKLFIINCINDVKGQDIICYEMKKYSIAKLMILCTGQSNRHVISIAQDMIRKLRNINFQIYGIEGLKFGEWILVDLGDIIVHIMQHNTRQSYALEKIWSYNNKKIYNLNK